MNLNNKWDLIKRKCTSKGNRGSAAFCIAFAMMLLFPAAGRAIDKHIELNGVTAATEVHVPEPDQIMSGEYQALLNNWIDENFQGRRFLINLRSQILYSAFRVSPNNNVVIGKENSLYDPMYIRKELAIDGTAGDEYFSALMGKLEQLQELLKAEGKELYLFVTPSKAYFCKEDIPDEYARLDRNETNDYQLLAEHLADSDLKYFDSHAYIRDYTGEDMNYPIYYPTGIHWSSPWGHRCAMEFEQYISQNSRWELSTLAQDVTEGGAPMWPDADLYQSLNLIKKPSGVQYYQSTLRIKEEKEHPNVFLRGGSFMDQSLNFLIWLGVFGEDVYFENSLYYKDKFSEGGTLSSFTAYDEFTELEPLLRKSDMLILECNEANAANMSWGFIDYILQHPDCIKYPEE